jgi:putative transposase
MYATITLTVIERKRLLAYYRSQANPHLRLRAHILLLLADGYAWATITAVLFCSSRTLARWNQRFRRGRLDAVLGTSRSRVPGLGPDWLAIVVDWVVRWSPRAFGLWRSRWCCATVVLLLGRQYRVAISAETVRRWLHRAQLVWRRPRPVLQRRDPQRQEKLQALRQLLRDLPADETVVFEDEVDVNLNPKIGPMWMVRGQQAEVVTPGDNAKCYLAGSLHWRTGQLLTTYGPKRDGHLFVAHLHDLRRRLRRYQKIHVICDNAKFHHDCWAVWEFTARYGERVVLHFLPKYAPECNPIERVWWHLHEEITRNHQCQSLNELIELVLGWLCHRNPFKIEGSVYEIPSAA